MDEGTLLIIDNDGTTRESRILFTCELEGFEYKYVVFQFDDNEEVSAARFIENENGEGELADVETDEEWNKLDEILSSYFDDLEAEDDK